MNIIICGSGRSGTTLMVNLLNAHPDILATNELNTFGNLDNTYSKLSNENSGVYNFIALHKSIDRIKMAEKVRTMGNDLSPMDVLTLFDEYVKVPYKIYCDKNPGYSTHMNEVMKKAGRNSKVIVCLRDPRDVICSQVKYTQMKPEERPRSWNGNLPGWTADSVDSAIKSRYWMNYMEPLDTWINANPQLSSNIYLLKYSDLVCNHLRVMNDLSVFLGLPNLKQVLEKVTIDTRGYDQWKTMFPDIKLPNDIISMMNKYGLEV